ncbi:MAG: hypothetical protein AB2A00_33090 [Myxococcota bacterium]
MTSRLLRLGFVLLLAVSGCRTTNHLPEYRERLRRVAVTVSGKPNVRVDLGQSTQKHGFTAAVSQGMAAAANAKLAVKLQSAFTADQMKAAMRAAAERMLVEQAGLELVAPEAADAVLDLSLRGYGVLADSPESPAQAAVDLGAEMTFLAEKKLIWERQRAYSAPIGIKAFAMGYVGGVPGVEYDKLISGQKNISNLLLLDDASLQSTFLAYSYDATWTLCENLVKGLRP